MRVCLAAALVTVGIGCEATDTLPGVVGEAPQTAEVRRTEGVTGPEAKLKPVALQPGPRLALPERLDLGAVLPDQTRTERVKVVSEGGAPLVLKAFRLTGPAGFRFSPAVTGGQRSYVTPGDEWVPFAAPILLKPGESREFEVGYAAADRWPAWGSLAFETNEPDLPPSLQLVANQAGACIAVSSVDVQFGGRVVRHRATMPVTVTSCGDIPLAISEIAMGGGSGHFSFELGKSVPAPSAGEPLRLEPGKSFTFEVVYVPEEAPPIAGDLALLERATLVIRSNAPEDAVEITASGIGTKLPVATAVGTIVEGAQVIPQTVLHLSAADSFGPGAIVQYEWAVKQPKGSKSVFVPSAFVASPTFEANVAGEYLFSLHVWDQRGNPSVVPWTAAVLVLPIDEIHVELLWHTPHDPDETDSGPDAGADLDLHFAHPYATDSTGNPWFNQPYDCFWFTPEPNWGSFAPLASDDPRLDRDDTDGAGPENLNLDALEAGTSYRIGVHYWNDHGFGPSRATVRVYIAGMLVAELPEVPLNEGDMWSAATVDWPSGLVTPSTNADGELDITPHYQNPFITSFLE